MNARTSIDESMVLDLAGPPAGVEERKRLYAADPFDDRSEPFFELRDRLFERAPGDDGAVAQPLPMQGIIGVLSPDAGDGRSHVAANLAAALAHGGARTLLMDADVHQTKFRALLSASPRVGFRDLIRETQEVPIGRMAQTHMLSVLTGDTAATGDPSLLLEEAGLRQVLAGYRSRFDCLVLDTPPASRVRDALLIASCCDVVVIVGRKGRTRLADLRRLVNRVSRAGARVGGIVLNEH